MAQDNKIEEAALRFFKFVHPDVDWNISGTCDDESWERFRQRCLYEARKICQLFEQGIVYKSEEE